MTTDPQRTLAVWTVLVVPFALLVPFLWSRDDLSLGFVAAYWFAPTMLTLIGTLPAPWEAVPS